MIIHGKASAMSKQLTVRCWWTELPALGAASHQQVSVCSQQQSPAAGLRSGISTSGCWCGSHDVREIHDPGTWQLHGNRQHTKLLTHTIINIKSFPSHEGPKGGANLFLALSQTPAYGWRPQIQSWCIAWCACLCPSFRWHQDILLGDKGTWVWTTCPRLLLNNLTAQQLEFEPATTES